MKHDMHILLVEDSIDDAELLKQTLLQAGLAPELHRVDSAAAMADALAQRPWDMVISDYNLPGFSGSEALYMLRAHSEYIPFVVVSGRIGEEEAVALMKSGADDYVMKDRLARLAPTVVRCLREAQNHLDARRAQLALLESEARFKAIVSNMPGMVFRLELGANDAAAFTYVSDGCQALLEIPAERLLQDVRAFLDRVLPEDLPSLLQSMNAAFRRRGNWNWEGRIQIDGSSELKWVDLRSRSRSYDSGMCWEGIVSNITQNKVADLEIRRAHENLARLSAHVEVIKEQERSRIAREIHDDLGGTLTAIKIMLLRLGHGLQPDAAEAQHRLHSTETLVDSALDITRRIATELRPGILDLGIVAAIEWQVAEFEKRMEIKCQVTCAYHDIALDGKTSIAVFRIFQEALTNIAKHSGATQVEVELEADTDSVMLQVHDNGRGISENDLSKPHSFGILGMQERARSLGGELNLRRTRSGTTLKLRLPCVLQDAETSDGDAVRRSPQAPEAQAPRVAPAPEPGAKIKGFAGT